jgi:hypothetical protein
MKRLITLLLILTAAAGFRCTDGSEDSSPSAAEEGIQVRINGGDWISLPGTAQRLSRNQYTLHSTMSPDNNSFISISWRGIEPTGYYRWNFISTGPEDGNFFQSKLHGNFDYHSFYVNEKTALDSPGSIVITTFDEVGGRVRGTFTIDKASWLNNALPGTNKGTVRIEGRFNVKRTI